MLRSFASPALLFVCLFASFSHADEPLKLKYPLGLKKMKIPKDNPLTKGKVELGKQLFFDTRLSSDNTVSCASCHDPKKGWSNGERFATGVDGQKGGRSAPTVINSGYQYFQFWDGRAHQLEGQALGPIENPIEMNLPLDKAVAKLNKIPGYKSQFKKVFGTEVTTEGMAQAISSFERTVLSGDAPFDRHKAGQKKAMSEAAVRGMDLFFNKARCSACHSGPNFTDGAFHNLGVGIRAKEPDLGRFSVDKLEGSKGSFKTPTLRDIARTAPYMHDGSQATLEDVVKFYNEAGEKNPQLDEEMKPLKLTDQEMKDVVIFLKEGLASHSYPDVEAPKLP